MFWEVFEKKEKILSLSHPYKKVLVPTKWQNLQDLSERCFTPWFVYEPSLFYWTLTTLYTSVNIISPTHFQTNFSGFVCTQAMKEWVVYGPFAVLFCFYVWLFEVHLHWLFRTLEWKWWKIALWLRLIWEGKYFLIFINLRKN